MKRRFVVAFVIVAVLLLTGCGAKMIEKVEENTSEITKQFFFGESEKMYATLAVGEREENYLMDGKSHPKTDFSLFSVVFYEDIDKNIIVVSLSVDEKRETFEMEYNSFSNSFMADLGKRDFSDKNIVLSYGDQSVVLENLSKQFGVDWKKAIEIGCDNLKQQIENAEVARKIDAEFYLKVLDKKANNFDNFFWCFTLLTKNGDTYSVVISTIDGSVLAKTK